MKIYEINKKYMKFVYEINKEYMKLRQIDAYFDISAYNNTFSRNDNKWEISYLF